jgi:hypothetical protein
MSISFDRLHKDLKGHQVRITFKSMKSGRMITSIYTLHDTIINKQNESERIICFDVLNDRYEDIFITSIVEYEIV